MQRKRLETLFHARIAIHLAIPTKTNVFDKYVKPPALLSGGSWSCGRGQSATRRPKASS